MNLLISLGQNFFEDKLFKEVLKSLQERLQAKLTTIEENKDVNQTKVEKLMECQDTNYEMNFKKRKSEKSISLKASHDDDDDSLKEFDDIDEEKVSNFTRSYAKFFRMNVKSGNNNREKLYFHKYTNKCNNSNKSKGKNLKIKIEEIHCEECERFGHVLSKCMHTMKKKKIAAMNMTSSDNDVDYEENELDHYDHASNLLAFEAKLPFQFHDSRPSETDSIKEDESSDEGQQIDYKHVHNQWIKMIAKTKVLERKMVDLLKYKQETEVLLQKLKLEIIEKDTFLSSVKAELFYAKETIQELTISDDRLDQILSVGKLGGDKRDPGFVKYKSHLRTATAFGKDTYQDHLESSKSVAKPNRFVPTCHYCGTKGHIKPRCFQFLKFLKGCGLQSKPTATYVKEKTNEIYVNSNFDIKMNI